jgi:hypothetical protein
MIMHIPRFKYHSIEKIAASLDQIPFSELICILAKASEFMIALAMIQASSERGILFAKAEE